MVKILFICHGNICRSVMAEYMMKNLVRQLGREADFYIDSAATSLEEIGNPIYPPAARKLQQKGVPYGNHRSRQVRPEDYEAFDLLLLMDENNLRNLQRIIPKDPQGKVRLLMDYTGRHEEIADPWYTGNFEETYQDLLESIQALLDQLGEGV